MVQEIEIPSGSTLTANGTPFISIDNNNFLNNSTFIR